MLKSVIKGIFGSSEIEISDPEPMWRVKKTTVINGNNSIQVGLGNDNTITINGKTYSGKTITIKDGEVYVDGEKQEGDKLTEWPKVVIKGNVESISLTAGDITVEGDVEKAETTSGNIKIKGDCKKARSVSGNIQADGNIECADTMSGNIIKGK